MENLVCRLVPENGTRGHQHVDRLSVFTVHLLSATREPVLGLEDPAHPQMCQCFQIFLDLEYHVAAATSVPAVRAPEGNKLLTAERNTARSAVTRGDFDSGFVDEAFQL